MQGEDLSTSEKPKLTTRQIYVRAAILGAGGFIALAVIVIAVSHVRSDPDGRPLMSRSAALDMFRRMQLWDLGPEESNILGGRRLMRRAYGPDAQYPNNRIEIWWHEDEPQELKAVTLYLIGPGNVRALGLAKRPDDVADMELRLRNAFRNISGADTNKLRNASAEPFPADKSVAEAFTGDKRGIATSATRTIDGVKVGFTVYALPINAGNAEVYETLYMANDGSW